MDRERERERGKKKAAIRQDEGEEICCCCCCFSILVFVLDEKSTKKGGKTKHITQQKHDSAGRIKESHTHTETKRIQKGGRGRRLVWKAAEEGD